jgi:YVTN family beta-propeller protein
VLSVVASPETFHPLSMETAANLRNCAAHAHDNPFQLRAGLKGIMGEIAMRRILMKGFAILGIASLLCLTGCGTAPPVTIQPNPVPTVATIFPNSAMAGGAAFTLTVNGTNFVAASIISFGGAAAPTTFVSSTQLTAAIPSAAIASAGTATVTVTNPAPGGGTSNSLNFTIAAATTNPVPTITSLIQSCAPVNGGAFKLLVNGSGLVPSSIVQWNGSDLPTTFLGPFNGLLLISAQVPASDIAVTGSPVVAAITVFNPPPGGGTSNSSNFTILAGGVGPQSIAVDPTGRFAYVANNGCPDDFVGNVTTYTINSTTGALTAVLPNVSADFGPISVAVAPSGKWVYVANDGAREANNGSIFVYDLDGTTGALTLTGDGTGCQNSSTCITPFSLAVHPSGKFAYVADEGGLFPTIVSIFSIDATSGAFTSIGTISAGGRAEAVTLDPTGNFAYVANVVDPGGVPGNVSAYSINSITGALTSIGMTAAGTDPASLAVDPTGKFVYVANSGSSNVSMYTINTTTGALTSIGQVSAGMNPSSVAVDPTGKFAYVTNSGSADVSMYTIGVTTGALTFMGSVMAGSAPSSIAIHPSGKFAYVTNFGSNSVSTYSINTTTGTLTLIGTAGT